MNASRLTLILVIIFSIPSRLHSQNSNCPNLSFELGTFTNWVGYTWLYSTEVPSINTSKVAGIVNRRQTIMSDTTAYDANTGYALRKIPSGYKYSARLGDEIVNSDGNPRGWEQSLRYTMKIDSSNALLIIKFACVLQYASDHTALMEPRFRFNILDKSGNVISDCSNYDVYSSNSYVKGFNTYTPSNSTGMGPVSPVKWRDWTTVGANLSKYIGQTITIEFMAADCTGRYHYGYAYFLAECHPLIITVKYCSGDSVAKLTAPDGFETYQWTNGSGVVVDTSRILTLTRPNEGETYYCTMLSATGCTVTLQSTIAKYMPKADFTSYMIDCKSNTVQFTNLSTGTHGTLQYKWDFGDSVTSTEKNPRHTFKTSGLHPMMLTLKNSPSTCVDTLWKVVESFSPPLVGIKGDSTYCPNLGIYLKAYGAYKYDWSTGSNADSIEVKAPGGKFWMVGHSSTGCVSDTIKKTVTEEPDWEFTSDSDTTLCKGQSVVLSVSGAYRYLWNNGDTVSTLNTSKAGTYSVTGSNKRGCLKEKTFNVIEYPIPKVDFSISAYTINTRHNQISCSVPQEADVNYIWKISDGFTETSSSFQHSFYVTNEILQYKIFLKATSIYDCADSSYKIIDVTPFVPNVFSPNNDGVNDVFMPSLDMKVFDRNGSILYNGNTGWDGKYNGKSLDPDTYFYLIRYKDRNQQEKTIKGYVTLIK